MTDAAFSHWSVLGCTGSVVLAGPARLYMTTSFWGEIFHVDEIGMERRLVELNTCTKLLQLTYRNPVSVRQLVVRNDNAGFMRVNTSRRPLQRPDEI